MKFIYIDLWIVFGHLDHAPADAARRVQADLVLQDRVGEVFPGIVTGDDNVTAGRLSSAPAILSYGLRVMHHYATGEGVNVPAAFAATLPVLGTPHLNEEAFATLTLGSGAAAMVMCRRDLAPRGHPYLGGVTRAATQFNRLCTGQMDRMVTDSRPVYL